MIIDTIMQIIVNMLYVLLIIFRYQSPDLKIGACRALILLT